MVTKTKNILRTYSGLTLNRSASQIEEWKRKIEKQ